MSMSKGCASPKAMSIQDSCTTTQDHGDIQFKLQLGAMSGSMALLWPDSELTSMAPVATEGNSEACSLDRYLNYVGFRGSGSHHWTIYKLGGPCHHLGSWCSGPELWLWDVSGSMAVPQPGSVSITMALFTTKG